MYKCPVCGRFEFEEPGDFEFCDSCGWQNDGVQAEFPDMTGANNVTLNEAKNIFSEWLNDLLEADREEYEKKFPKIQ